MRIMLVKRWGIRILVIVAGIAAGFALSASGAVEATLLSTSKDVAPGGFVTHVFSVSNSDAVERTVQLTFVTPFGWGVLGAPSSLTVDPGAEETLFVTLTIPANAEAGSYSVVLEVSGPGAPSPATSATAEVVVTTVSEIEVVPPSGESVAPGGELSYLFAIVNRGNAQESLSLEVTSSRGFAVESSSQSAHLAPQERLTLSVALSVPGNAAPGRDVLTVRAVSTLHPGVEDEAVVFSTILPPPPEAVDGSLMETLASRLRISIDREELPEGFSSQLSFSTSGRILGGLFSSTVSAAGIFGPDPFSVSSYTLLYRRDPATYTLGTVAVQPTDLISLSCEGGAVVVDDTYLDVAMIAGGSGDETRFAGHVALGPDDANVGFAYYDVRTDAARSAAWTGTAAATPLEDWDIRAEAGLGTEDGKLGRALFFATTLDTTGYFFSGEAYSVGTYFPGPLSDQAGITLSQRLRLDAFSLSLSLSHTWDNVIRDPLVSTEIIDELGLDLSATPIADGPLLETTLEFAWDRYDDPALGDDVNLLVSYSLAQSDGVFPYSFEGRMADRIDRNLGTHQRTSTYGEGVGLSIDSFYLFLKLTQESLIDVVSGSVLSSASNATLSFQPAGTRHQASITFRNEEDDFDLSASLTVQFTDSLELAFDGSISWDRADATDVTFGWGIAATVDFNLPVPFLVTRGRIVGRAFVDVDGDGLFDNGDRPAGGIIVSANRTQVSTNAAGEFRFPPLNPGSYTLTVDQLPLDSEYQNPVSLTLEAGETATTDIALVPIALVSGRLFDDANQDGVFQTGEGGFENVRILLKSAEGRTIDAFTDSQGRFILRDVLPGDYTLSVDPNTLPDRFEFTTAETADVTVAFEQAPQVQLGGYVKPREVVITFQPPTADFDYSPHSPQAGELVLFDGTLSFDFDGQIVSYAWDFDADGTPDATSATAERSFADPGTYPVSLTVTDDGGNTDTTTAEVAVAAPPTGSLAPADVSVLPVPEFYYAPLAPTVGAAVTFDGASSTDPDGQVTAYAWDFETDGVIDARTALVVHTFEAAGRFDVSLTVTDDEGNQATQTQAVTVTAASGSQTEQAPVASFEYAPQSPTAGATVLFDASASSSGSNHIASYTWDFGADGTTDAVGPAVGHTFSSPGTVSVRLTITDDAGNADSVTHDLVIGEPAPAVDQTPTARFVVQPAHPDVAEPVRFDGSSSSEPGGTIRTYAWDFDGDGASDADGVTAVHLFEAAGTYNVSLTVTDDAGVSRSTSLPVQVGAESLEGLKPPLALFTFSPKEPIVGQSVSFDGSASADPDGQIEEYAWDFDVDGTPDAATPQADHTFVSAGIQTVSLTVTDDAGLSATAIQTISVIARQPSAAGGLLPPIADAFYEPAAPQAREPIRFNASPSSDPDGSIVAYAWDFDADGQPDASTVIATWSFPAAGTYEVSLRVSDDAGNADTLTFSIDVGPADTSNDSPQPPVANIQYSPATPQIAEPVMFSAASSFDPDGDIVRYEWDLNGDGSVDSTDPMTVYVFPSYGTFNVELTVFDASGNSDSLVVSITIE
jgi:PKD repeat protein